MAYPPIQDSLGSTSPGRRGRNGRKGRYRRHRHRRNQGSAPKSDSDNEMSDTTLSDSSTTTVANHQPKGRYEAKKRSAMDESMFVALDCEMVGVGPNGKQSSLARVTLLDWNGNVVMDEHVKQQQEVTDYRTFVSGITAQNLWAARMDLTTCRQHVLTLLAGKILVGHGLKNDLRVLGITHPWHMIRDTAKYEPFMKVRFQDGVLWPRGLKELCLEKLNKQIQSSGGPHCPKEDAMAALDLYRTVQYKWEKAMEYKIMKTRAIEQQQCQMEAAARE